MSQSLSVVMCISSSNSPTARYANTGCVAHHTPHAVCSGQPHLPLPLMQSVPGGFVLGPCSPLLLPMLPAAATPTAKHEQVGRHTDTDTNTATQRPHSSAKARHVTTCMSQATAAPAGYAACDAANKLSRVLKQLDVCLRVRRPISQPASAYGVIASLHLNQQTRWQVNQAATLPSTVAPKSCGCVVPLPPVVPTVAGMHPLLLGCSPC